MLKTPTETEVPLAGGRTTCGVVRIGDTVRRPIGENSSFVHKLLNDLEEKKFQFAPKYLGMDEKGREILSFIDGVVPTDLGDFTHVQIKQGAEILSELHKITESMTNNGEVICHGDASPANFVFKDGLPIAMIDFDAAHVGTLKEDVGYSSWLWSNLGFRTQNSRDIAEKLIAFLAGYKEFDRSVLVESIVDAQRILLERFTVELDEGKDMLAGIEWVTNCQQWLKHNGEKVEFYLSQEEIYN